MRTKFLYTTEGTVINQWRGGLRAVRMKTQDIIWRANVFMCLFPPSRDLLNMFTVANRMGWFWDDHYYFIIITILVGSPDEEPQWTRRHLISSTVASSFPLHPFITEWGMREVSSSQFTLPRNLTPWLARADFWL